MTGEYGAPTASSLRARELVLEADGGQQLPWLCHTFSSKAMGYLADSLADGTIPFDDTIAFWCTKTLVQPGGDNSVFLQARESSKPVLSYIKECSIHCADDFHSQQYTKAI